MRGGILGHEHDLSVFRKELTRDEEPLADGTILEAPLGLIERRWEDLRQEAGPRLFAEKPKLLTRRIRCYWDVWRSHD